ncbi:MAG: hypothetical protein ACXAD7_23930 [Candidatus Kariarchaeaceae archaeon]|jgi:DNA-binding transcriptional ArsR family regulator
MDNSGLKANYEDLITFKPPQVIDIGLNEGILINQQAKIFNALRRNNMTVKEIHQLYYIPEENAYEKSERTIYRYLKKLEEAGIVVIGGRRVTEGKLTVENIYCLASRFFYYAEPRVEWWSTKEAIEASKHLSALIHELMPDKEIPADMIYQFYKTLAEQDRDITLELINFIDKEYARNNKVVKNLIALDHPHDRRLILFTVSILTFLRNFDLIDKFKKTAEN